MEVVAAAAAVSRLDYGRCILMVTVVIWMISVGVIIVQFQYLMVP